MDSTFALEMAAAGLRDWIQNTSEMMKSKMTAMSFSNWLARGIY